MDELDRKNARIRWLEEKLKEAEQRIEKLEQEQINLKLMDLGKPFGYEKPK